LFKKRPFLVPLLSQRPLVLFVDDEALLLVGDVGRIINSPVLDTLTDVTTTTTDERDTKKKKTNPACPRARDKKIIFFLHAKNLKKKTLKKSAQNTFCMKKNLSFLGSWCPSSHKYISVIRCYI